MDYYEFKEQVCKALNIEEDSLDFSQEMKLKAVYEDITDSAYKKGFNEGRDLESNWR